MLEIGLEEGLLGWFRGDVLSYSAQHHPTLPLCAVMMLSNRVSLGPLDSLVAFLKVIPENSHCKRLSEGLSPWLNYTY